jgi:hypothetical protein
VAVAAGSGVSVGIDVAAIVGGSGVAVGVAVEVMVARVVGTAVSVNVGTGVKVAVPTTSCALACVEGLPVAPQAVTTMAKIVKIMKPVTAQNERLC